MGHFAWLVARRKKKKIYTQVWTLPALFGCMQCLLKIMIIMTTGIVIIFIITIIILEYKNGGDTKPMMHSLIAIYNVTKLVINGIS